MPRKEDDPGPMRNISVGLYGHTDDDEFEGKIVEIEFFLTKNGGECSIDRSDVSAGDENILIEFHATIPEWFVNMHHAFDSVLNSTTKGFGYAWVEDR